MHKKYLMEDDPLWYKDAIIYQLHVKTFFDNNEDGIGDFKGLTKKLDYLESLGINTIWILPFYPSPLKDDGYDIADYYTINTSYGNIKDFKLFLKEAHNRGLRVVTELVVNHTSDQHPWFQRARRAKKGSSTRNFYMWNDDQEKYKDARIIFKDFETSNWTWDPVAKQYYWHRFYSHQPDLNYDNPAVHKEIFKIMEFWFNMGVDGVRLDAIPYLYSRDGTNCENLPETFKFLEKLRTHLDKNFKNKMLLAEANQWPEDSVNYFGKGDQCHMNFHFPIMPRMYMALQMEDKFPLIDILEQTPDIPDNCQWAIFLRNHDELTLEMVTDEERDYMYRVYAKDPKARINLGIRRRLAPLLGNHRRKIELMNSLLFSLPGSPIIYYGDEIGMGDNYYLGDRNGVRTPMQWSSDKNAGFSRANPHELYLPIIIEPEYHYESVNVENQENNLTSLLWWTRRLISIRKRYKSFGRGSMEIVQSDNPKVFTFIRKYENEVILVAANLSGSPQVVELNLSQYEGYIPEEISSKNRFPAIKESPYILTPGPYDFYWFTLLKEKTSVTLEDEPTYPKLRIKDEWKKLPLEVLNQLLENKILYEYIKNSPLIKKAKKVQKIEIIENFIVNEKPFLELIIFQANFLGDIPETYPIILSRLQKDQFETLRNEIPKDAIIAELTSDYKDEILYDGLYNIEIRKEFLDILLSKKTIKGKTGEIIFNLDNKLKNEIKNKNTLTSTLSKLDYNNILVVYDSTLFMKVYRRSEHGKNPDIELTKFLNDKKFEHVPQSSGCIEYKGSRNDSMVIAMIQNYIPNQGNAWNYTLDEINRYFERVLSMKTFDKVPNTDFSTLLKNPSTIETDIQELISIFNLEMMLTLGKRTGELHCTLASEYINKDFEPEAFSTLYQRSVYQSIRSKVKRATNDLKKNIKYLPDDLKETSEKIVDIHSEILDYVKRIVDKKINSMKIRTHGDYSLKQALYTGKDFYIIDFEGHVNKALSERRLKRSPFRDVAGMLTSFYYAAYFTFLKYKTVIPKEIDSLFPWLNVWFHHISNTFVYSYYETTKNTSFMPKKEEFEFLIKIFLLHKLFGFLEYELNRDSGNAEIPLKGIEFVYKNYIKSIK